MTIVRGDFSSEYRYQLKGLRKNFQTLMFAEELAEWDDPQIALLKVSKRMKHSAEHITFHHYIEDMEALGLRKGDPVPSVKDVVQSRVSDFCGGFL